MRRWHMGGAALLLAAGSLTAVGVSTASAAADPQGKPFDGANLRDASVTYSKLALADGDIPAAKVAGVLSQSALDQLAADLAAGLEAADVRFDQLGADVSSVRTSLGDLRDALGSAAAEPGTGLVHWSQLLGMPPGFVDGQDDVDGGAAADLICASLCVSDAEIADISAHKIQGHIAPGQLAGDITGQLIADASLTAADLAGAYDHQGVEVQAGAVSSAQIKDDAVELRDLSPEVREWLPRITVATVGTPGGQVTIPAGERAQVVLPTAGIGPGDFLSVSPPVMSGQLLFAGAQTGSDAVSAWVLNAGASEAVLVGDWQVSWIDVTP